ncbi:hypothetical protein [Streptomyces sp. YIM S03343]
MSEPTPVVEDANATSAELLARAADDLAAAKAAQEQKAREDRINAQQGGQQ